MKNLRIALVITVVLLALGLWWQLQSPQPEPTEQAPVATNTPSEPSASETQTSATPPEQAARLKEAADLVDKIFSSPIDFYGRAVDQHGNPVPHADVGYTAADKFNRSGTNYTGQTDAQGFFQITGIQGAALGVAVRKVGYYFINETDKTSPSSAATFGYSMGPDSYRRVPPTKENPAVFILHKMGETVPLIRVEQSSRIPKDGTPSTVDLMHGRLSPSGNFRVEAWTEAPAGGRKFTWRCRVTVPGGGLVERKGQFDFEAPEDGYAESVEIDMSATSEGWSSQQQRDFFVKLPDRRYARVNFTMIAGGNHYFLLESFLNPTSGDRNLEFDPEKAIKP